MTTVQHNSLWDKSIVSLPCIWIFSSDINIKNKIKSCIPHWATLISWHCNKGDIRITGSELVGVTHVFGMLGVKQWIKHNNQLFSLDSNYATCTISHKPWWPNPLKRCTVMKVDWRTHFLWDLIINYCLSGKLGRVSGFQWPDWLIGGCLRKALLLVL